MKARGKVWGAWPPEVSFGSCGDHEVLSPAHEERLERVLDVLLRTGARSVLDLGCGSGELLLRMARRPQFRKITGIDVSGDALRGASRLLGDAAFPADGGRMSLVEASFAEPDSAFEGFDAAALVETIEHVNPDRLSNVERTVFGSYRPGTVVVTTPNREYNMRLGIPAWAFRHPDHRFEWTRAKFRAWARGIARRNIYAVQFDEIGEADPLLGSETQMATFRRLQGRNE